MKYYLHDTSSFDDEKISELFINFGYEGLGLFYTILEKIGKQEKPVKTLVLKSQLKVGKRLEKCWNFMESLGIISSNNGETFNKQLLNFSEKYKIKSEKNAKRISEWREKQEVIENVTRSESVRNTPKVNESKVNESKHNEIEESQYLEKFEKFRILYPGLKKGLSVEFGNFAKKHKDYKNIIDSGELIRGLESQIAFRKALLEKKESYPKLFIEEWKHLTTWINQSCWTIINTRTQLEERINNAK